MESFTRMVYSFSYSTIVCDPSRQDLGVFQNLKSRRSKIDHDRTVNIEPRRTGTHFSQSVERTQIRFNRAIPLVSFFDFALCLLAASHHGNHEESGRRCRIFRADHWLSDWIFCSEVRIVDYTVFLVICFVQATKRMVWLI